MKASARRKKALEQLYAEEAAERLGQDWQLGSEREQPDFLVRRADAVFGLEVTSVHINQTAVGGSERKQREGRNQRRIGQLRRSWELTHDHILKVHVLGDFSDRNSNEVLHTLKGLSWAELSLGDPARRFETPSGLKVFVSLAVRSEWLLINDCVGWVRRDGLQEVQAAIDRKATKLGAYREAAGDDVRLLVVADHRRASGLLYLESQDMLDLKGFSRLYFLVPGISIQTTAGS